MDKQSNGLIDSIRALFEPIVKVSSQWPPVLAYGTPLIIAVLLIVLLRSALPTNLIWLVAIVVLAPLFGYVYMDRDRRHLDMQLEMARLSEKMRIMGNVLFSDGTPVRGARVFVEGVDRFKETDETGWFQIEVYQQETWIVRATFREQTGEAICDKTRVTQPIRITLEKLPKQLLTITYNVKELDGCATTKIGNQEYYVEGCKFRLRLLNAGSSKMIIDALNFHIKEYKPLLENPSFKLDAARMRFGQPRFPHQILLHLWEKKWYGYWNISKETEFETININGESDNLLEVSPPVVFEIEPGETELIYGAIKIDKEGIYTFEFSIGYNALSVSEQKIVKTQLVRLIQPKKPKGE